VSTNRAYSWLSTLVLDNNINVSHKLPDGDLKKFAQAYGTFQFRLAADVSSVQKKTALINAAQAACPALNVRTAGRDTADGSQHGLFDSPRTTKTVRRQR
jgi:hypothetical protein